MFDQRMLRDMGKRIQRSLGLGLQNGLRWIDRQRMPGGLLNGWVGIAVGVVAISVICSLLFKLIGLGIRIALIVGAAWFIVEMFRRGKNSVMKSRRDPDEPEVVDPKDRSNDDFQTYYRNR